MDRRFFSTTSLYNNPSWFCGSDISDAESENGDLLGGAVVGLEASSSWTVDVYDGTFFLLFLSSSVAFCVKGSPLERSA